MMLYNLDADAGVHCFKLFSINVTFENHLLMHNPIPELLRDNPIYIYITSLNKRPFYFPGF
jgi:hypothetical protein